MSIKNKIKNINMSENKKKARINKKFLKNGTYNTAMTIVFIGIVVVINLMVNSLPSKYTQLDISDKKIYSIGSQTKEMLKDLDEDVTIYQITQKGYEDEVISNLLQKYADESKHIKVEIKDPVVNPKFVSEYTSDNISLNSLIVVSGERNKVVDYRNLYETAMDYNTYTYQTTGFDGEGQITSAIAYVTSENLPVLYTLEGHGEAGLSSAFQEDIEKGNMEIRSLNLLTEGSVPEDANCLMINAPASDISVDEKDAILQYLEKGGKAMIFSDYTGKAMENFDQVLESYGIKRMEGIVFEGDSQHYAMQTPYYLIPTVNSTELNAKTALAGYYVLAPYAQGIQIMEDARDTLEINELLSTSDDSYSKINLSSDTFEKEKEDLSGPFALAVSVTEDVKDGQTQVIYYSTSGILNGQINQLVSGGNEQLVMESLSWMTDTDETTSVSIPSKSLETNYLTFTNYEASFWKICTIGLIPGVFLAVGFVIWLKRRKA